MKTFRASSKCKFKVTKRKASTKIPKKPSSLGKRLEQDKGKRYPSYWHRMKRKIKNADFKAEEYDTEQKSVERLQTLKSEPNQSEKMKT